VNVNVNVKKDRGRRRRLAGWGLMGCAVLLATVWVFSAVVPWSVRIGACEVRVQCGLLVVRRNDGLVAANYASVALVRASIAQHQVKRELDWMRSSSVEMWWWRWRTGPAWHVGAPIWAMAVAVGAVGMGMIRWGWDQRRKGVCAACGYDLRGLGMGAVCPECGMGAK
jgi:hypothetical protein